MKSFEFQTLNHFFRRISTFQLTRDRNEKPHVSESCFRCEHITRSATHDKIVAIQPTHFFQHKQTHSSFSLTLNLIPSKTFERHTMQIW